MNIIEKAGILAIGTRLLRVHDLLRIDANTFYKAQGFDFETKWFSVMYVLSVQSPLSVTEISAEIGLSHPTTITLLKELENKKFIESIKDEKDERKRNIQLTPTGSDLVKSLKPIWKMIINVLTKLTSNQNNLFEAINEVEDRLRESSFLQRMEALATDQGQVKSDLITIKKIEVQEELAIAQAILQQVQLQKGELNEYDPIDGYIFYMAFVNGLPAGTAVISLIDHNANLDELAVLDNYKSMGIEEALLEAIKTS
ncbi:MarR family transcriptional regulator [Pedobacter sp. Hv1]|uniref:MarR family transcriptional regulator n=1 Tax=Pedobacter sp. Hv1 TaxID=1740090 RepID=UPI0009E82064|nr:MarR family transcriptional regulator [Pedobacter sp. Hv1]